MGNAVVYESSDTGTEFATPAIDLDTLVSPRSVPSPMLNLKVAEIIDFLVETGKRMASETNPHVRACIDGMSSTNVLPKSAIEHSIEVATLYLRKELLTEIIEQNFRHSRGLDEWIPRVDGAGRRSFVRALPSRLIHVLPGNSPMAAVLSIAQGAIVKAVNLFKMSSSDPFTAVAVLRTMLDIDPHHAVPASMSAIYWRGGDESVECALYRPCYFDKIVAWGSGEAISGLMRYIRPGFHLISFDPKTSVSMIGAEAFASEEDFDEVVKYAAADVTILNQQACNASRIMYVEGTSAQIDHFCSGLQQRLLELSLLSGRAPPLPRELVDEIEVLRTMEDIRVWGLPDGSGLIIRSETPVGFQLINNTVNIVRVPSLATAIEHVSTSTQTVGIYPPARQFQLRDLLASTGAQRIVHLGDAAGTSIGAPHDATYPLSRFVHWAVHEDGIEDLRPDNQRCSYMP